jgi:hypothetical protein
MAAKQDQLGPTERWQMPIAITRMPARRFGEMGLACTDAS